jgi:hypothetical protein
MLRPCGGVLRPCSGDAATVWWSSDCHIEERGGRSDVLPWRRDREEELDGRAEERGGRGGELDEHAHYLFEKNALKGCSYQFKEEVTICKASEPTKQTCVLPDLHNAVNHTIMNWLIGPS